jgi:UDP-N-acetylglucosamine--N-acetylmuramyl-(pentapeptide) pyrophosphoryl-undecaprenol N-acetylglucosamine transferase
LATAIHEANIRPGLANRWIARLVDRVYVNHAETAQVLASQRLVVIGWPVRSYLCELAELPRQSWHGVRPARILVCAASRGGSFFAREVPALLERLASTAIPLEVHHQSGDVEPLPIELAYTRAGIVAHVSPFIDDMAAAYRWADLAIVRAGAGTIAELAIAGLPALLVPLADAADDHQTVNARAFVAAGAAAWAQDAGDSPPDAVNFVRSRPADDGLVREATFPKKTAAGIGIAQLVVELEYRDLCPQQQLAMRANERVRPAEATGGRWRPTSG